MLIIGNGLGVHGSQAGDSLQTLNGYRGCQPIKLWLYPARTSFRVRGLMRGFLPPIKVDPCEFFLKLKKKFFYAYCWYEVCAQVSRGFVFCVLHSVLFPLHKGSWTKPFGPKELTFGEAVALHLWFCSKYWNRIEPYVYKMGDMTEKQQLLVEAIQYKVTCSLSPPVVLTMLQPHHCLCQAFAKLWFSSDDNTVTRVSWPSSSWLSHLCRMAGGGFRWTSKMVPLQRRRICSKTKV